MGRSARARRLSPGRRCVAPALRAMWPCPYAWPRLCARRASAPPAQCPAPPVRAARRALSAVLEPGGGGAARLSGAALLLPAPAPSAARAASPELRRAPRAPRASGVRADASLKRCRIGGVSVLELPDSCSPEDVIRASATGHRWSQTAPKMSARACCALLERAQRGPEVLWEKGDLCRGMPCCSSHRPT